MSSNNKGSGGLGQWIWLSWSSLLIIETLFYLNFNDGFEKMPGPVYRADVVGDLDNYYV